jgi:hypothetical protein
MEEINLRIELLMENYQTLEAAFDGINNPIELNKQYAEM